MTDYEPHEIEKKRRRIWERRGDYNIDLRNADKPYYVLPMFPYPSAEGLHVGNCYAYIGTDIFARYMKMKGRTVFEPMGFDAFGIHSENYALTVGRHPAEVTKECIHNYRENQLKRLGAMFDWSHSLSTTDPEYYRWTQWLFLQFFKRGLAVRKPGRVNWCPECKTVLADSQVDNGFCERHEDTPVTQKKLVQWFFRITEYAQRLLENLDKLDWDPAVVAVQRKKIGRSKGATVTFHFGDGTPLEIFTTRPDTLWGVSFIVLAPEHPEVDKVTTADQTAAVREYQEKTRYKSAFQRTQKVTDVEGVFTGAQAVNPVNGEKVPVFIADYVLEDYATGAIMGVPAHDKRDFQFAMAAGLPVVRVIVPDDPTTADGDRPYFGGGRMVNSGPFDGISTTKSVDAVTSWLEENRFGRSSEVFALRDWCVSRQRYWCPPIPLVHCDDCGIVPVREEDLPVLLPHTDDYIPDGSGKSPLARNEEWVRTDCPQCGKAARRETDGTDNFLDSAWYYLRYPSAGHQEGFVDDEVTRKWLPVDMYIGGREHAFGHLLYFRFVTMALHDMGYLPFEEPCKVLRGHGILTRRVDPEDPESPLKKISKKNGNVINPDDYFEKYGIDAFRLGLMYIAPFPRGGEFTDRPFKGCRRFVERTWRLVQAGTNEVETEKAVRTMRQTTTKVTRDIESLKYNTAIAHLMTCINVLAKEGARSQWLLETFVKLAAPFVPFVAEELWETLGHDGREASVFDEPWPEDGDG